MGSYPGERYSGEHRCGKEVPRETRTPGFLEIYKSPNKIQKGYTQPRRLKLIQNPTSTVPKLVEVSILVTGVLTGTGDRAAVAEKIEGHFSVTLGRPAHKTEVIFRMTP